MTTSCFCVPEVSIAGFDALNAECPSTSLKAESLQSLLFLDQTTKEVKKLTKSPPSVGMRTFISEDLALTISQSREFLLR